MVRVFKHERRDVAGQRLFIFASAIVSCWKSTSSSSNYCISILNGAEISSEFWVIEYYLLRLLKSYARTILGRNSAPKRVFLAAFKQHFTLKNLEQTT